MEVNEALNLIVNSGLLIVAILTYVSNNVRNKKARPSDQSESSSSTKDA